MFFCAILLLKVYNIFDKIFISIKYGGQNNDKQTDHDGLQGRKGDS